MAMNFSMLQTDVLPSAALWQKKRGANGCRNTAVTEGTTAPDGNADVANGLMIKNPKFVILLGKEPQQGGFSFW